MRRELMGGLQTIGLIDFPFWAVELNHFLIRFR